MCSLAIKNFEQDYKNIRGISYILNQKKYINHDNKSSFEEINFECLRENI